MKLKKGIPVVLLGAGPGDPSLLTLKGHAILSKADVVLHDTLVNPAVLKFMKRRALAIRVGGKEKHHPKGQETTNCLMKKYHRQGKNVVRLKSGDPFIFGRGGEEALYLLKEKIPFELVPGVTSALAAPTYAGIPLTMRTMNSMVTIVTGHGNKGTPRGPGVQWAKISPQSTLVILMGLSNISRITKRLRLLGWKKSLPAAIIRYGTWNKQEVLEGSLSTIAERARREKITSPVIIIIGKVVGLRKALK